MATNKNITMKQFNGTDYDTLYPKTIVEQVDGVYNKQEILEDTTKSMFGYGSSAIPDTIFQWLGKYNQYWWKRRAVGEHTEEVRTEKAPTTRINFAHSKTATRTIQYSDSVTFDSSNNPSLVNPSSVNVSYTNSSTTVPKLLGKYVKNLYASASTIYFIPLTATYHDEQDTEYNEYETYFTSTIYSITGTTVTDKGSWNYIYSSNRNAYPDSGVGDAYHYEPVLGSSSTGYLVSTNTGNSSLQNTIYYSNSIIIDTSGNISLESEQSIVLSYSSTSQANTLKGKYIRGVMNTSYGVDTSTIYYIPSDAGDATSRWDNNYTPAVALMISMQKVTTQQVVNSNAYEYQYLGVPFDNAVNGAKIETGSYIGTGTYGSSNPCSLTFGFSPSVLIISGVLKSKSTTISGIGSVVMNTSYGHYGESYAEYSINGIVETTENQVQWYSDNSTGEQMNTSGNNYYYIALG